MIVFQRNYEYFPSDQKLEPPETPSLKPLIVVVHGGPHWNLTGYVELKMFNLLRGYNILIPNFTGSCGYGQNHIENLLGKIGQVDVEEIIGFINQAIDQKLCDPEKIIIIGGSYGGYLSGIMATHPKYSSIFKAAILLNPCIDLHFMHVSSDICEWAASSSLGKKEWWHLEPEEVKLMYEQSPMSRHCKIPCLILLGSKDRRSVYNATLAFRNKALIEGAHVETFVYESGHSLANDPKMEYDVDVKMLSFIAKILKE